MQYYIWAQNGIFPGFRNGLGMSRDFFYLMLHLQKLFYLNFDVFFNILMFPAFFQISVFYKNTGYLRGVLCVPYYHILFNSIYHLSEIIFALYRSICWNGAFSEYIYI